MIYVSDQLAGLNHGNNHGAGVGAGGGGGGGGGGLGSGSSGGANGTGAGSGVFHAHSHTAAGRMHFRCLTCDRPHDSVPGAQTFRYASAQGKQQVMSGAGVISSESRLLELQLGEQVYLHGSDGNIYRGREPPSHQQQMLLQQSASSSNNNGGPLVPALPSSSSGELMRLVSPSNASTHRSGSPDKYTSASALASARAGKSRPTSADPSRSHAQGRQQIDPASGRRSSEHMQLPLSSITAMAMGGGEADSKEQWAEASSSTSRALHFPSPVKSSGAGGGGVSSGYSTSRAAISLHRASSNADLGGGGGGGGQGAASPGGSPLASVRTRQQVRPSTAQARTNAGSSSMADTSGGGGGGGGHVLVAKVAQAAAPAASRTRGGVELVNDPSDDS
jgi:hypothetical protein